MNPKLRGLGQCTQDPSDSVLGLGSCGEPQLGAALAMRDLCRDVEHLEAQSPEGFENPAIGTLGAVDARRGAGSKLELSHHLVGERAEQQPGAVGIPVLGRDRVEGKMLLELAQRLLVTPAADRPRGPRPARLLRGPLAAPRAARLHQELRRERGLEFLARMGLHSGEVVVGRIGDDLRMNYTAQRAVVNVAKRIEELAEPGECLSDRRHRRARPRLLRARRPGRVQSQGHLRAGPGLRPARVLGGERVVGS